LGRKFEFWHIGEDAWSMEKRKAGVAKGMAFNA
jgi:hypothetical protein